MKAVISGSLMCCVLALGSCVTGESAKDDGDTDSGSAKNSVTTTIGQGGGIVEFGDVLLFFPVAAVTGDTAITVTELTTDAPPPYINYSSVYQFEPEGLEFALPVEVHMPLGDAVDPYWLFWSTDVEDVYEPLEFELIGARARTEVTHFSTGFVGTIETQIDSFENVESGGLIDVLFVVDNSCSMYDEQVALTDSFPGLLSQVTSLNFDYHIGVVSTDMDDPAQSGRLHEANGVNYLDMNTPDVEATFLAMAQMGTYGSYNEQGRAAAYEAIEILGATDNAGFYRDDAYLAIVVLSDENDYSASPTLSDFVTWLTDLKVSTDFVSFSSIVGPPSAPIGPQPCAEAGTDYIYVTSAVGGTLVSICDADYSGALDHLSTEVAGTWNTLSQSPVVSTLVVSVVESTGTVVLTEDQYVYSETLNAVAVLPSGYAMTDESVLEVAYTPMPI
jgi:hypothetical protein